MIDLRTLSNDIFTIQAFPAQSNQSAFVTLQDAETLHLSKQLVDKFHGKTVAVYFDKKLDFIQLVAVSLDNKEVCFRFPQNGTRKIDSLATKLGANTKYPIKYVGYFCESDQVWRGQRVKDPFAHSATASRRKKKS